jgi:lipid-A-disaccharide synthase-like uncharacterized protein
MPLFTLVYTEPTPKKDLILYKIAESFECKLISNEALTFHFKGFVISIIILKQHSASVNPVIHIGLSLLDNSLLLSVGVSFELLTELSCSFGASELE